MTTPAFEERPDVDPEIEAALASVARPRCRPEFAEALRRRFLAAEAAARAGTGSHGPLPFPDRGVGRRRVLLRVGGVLAAAIIVAVGFLFLASPAPRWRVLDLGADAIVTADGKTLPSEDRTALARALQHAREIDVEGGDLVLQIGDVTLFDLAPGTRVALGGFDRSSNGAPYELRAAAGRLRARTGPDFQGRTMRIAADGFDATVRGTAFAIDYEQKGTCLCCLHGEVEIRSKADEQSKPIPPQRMCLVPRDGGAPIWGGTPEHHILPLEALEARARELWPRAAPR